MVTASNVASYGGGKGTACASQIAGVYLLICEYERARGGGCEEKVCAGVWCGICNSMSTLDQYGFYAGIFDEKICGLYDVGVTVYSLFSQKAKFRYIGGEQGDIAQIVQNFPAPILYA